MSSGISPEESWQVEVPSHLEDELSRRLIGQPEALRRVGRAFRRYHAGLKRGDRPIGCFLFAGPTGTGKTFLAQSLAEVAFGTPDALIRIHMAQYSSDGAVDQLVAADGRLTRAVRDRPHSLVLLEGVENAHRRALTLLQPVMETGSLAVGSGGQVDFRQALLVMTTTAGAEVLQTTTTFGFDRRPVDKEAEYRRSKENLAGALGRHFSPEFLGLLDDVILFRRLDRDDNRRLARIVVEQVKARMASACGIHVSVTDEARDYVAAKGYDPDYGAPPLLRAFEQLVEDPIVEEKERGALRAGMKVDVHLETNDLGEEQLDFRCD